MTYTSTDEIEELVNRFEKRTLPKSLWTHDAHLTVAIYYLAHNGFYESICLIRSGIIVYNQSVGGVNSPTGGYHETLTIFWLRTIYHYVTDQKNISLVTLCNNFLTSPFANKELPFHYYSNERLFSVEARAQWMEPDRKPLSF